MSGRPRLHLSVLGSPAGRHPLLGECPYAARLILALRQIRSLSTEMERRADRRLLAATLVALSLAATATTSCSGTPPPGPPLSLSNGLSALVGAVPAPAVEEVAGAVHLLTRSCPDLPTDKAAVIATLKAAKLVGLSADDDRWPAAGRALTGGLASHDPNAACASQLGSWLADGLVPATIPGPASSTTTAPLAQQAAELAKVDIPKVSARAYRAIETGMTIANVRKICGSKGQTVASTHVGRHRNDLVKWPAAGGLFVTVTVQFRDGRVLAATTTGAR